MAPLNLREKTHKPPQLHLPPLLLPPPSVGVVIYKTVERIGKVFVDLYLRHLPFY